MQWVPVKIKAQFGVTLDNVLVNGKDIGLCSQKNAPDGCFITFDSGSTHQSMPSYAIEILHQHNVPTTDKTELCKSMSDFGDLTYVIAGKNFVVLNNEWLYSPFLVDEPISQDQKKALVQSGDTTKNPIENKKEEVKTHKV